MGLMNGEPWLTSPVIMTGLWVHAAKEPVHKEKSLRHFHVTTAVAQPSSCSVAHVYMLACSKQKAASSCTFNTNSCTVNTKKEACLHRSGLFKWIIT